VYGKLRKAVELGDANVWKNLAVLVGLPWLKRKLDKKYDVHAAHVHLLGSGCNHEKDSLTPGASLKQRLIYYYK
jgi:hypothetical protein